MLYKSGKRPSQSKDWKSRDTKPKYSNGHDMRRLVYLAAVIIYMAMPVWALSNFCKVDQIIFSYLVTSAVTYALYSYDKNQAMARRWRLSENCLHLSGLVGWPGALFGQLQLRHKTKKPLFQMIFWASGLLHCIFWYYYKHPEYKNASIYKFFNVILQETHLCPA